MSTLNSSGLTGLFTRDSFPELVQAVAAKRSSGRLSLEVGAQRATLHFIQGRLAAAAFEQFSGALAFQYAAGSREGRYEFTESFVQLSQLSVDKRIHQTLEALFNLAPLSSTPASASTIPLERAPDESPAERANRSAQAGTSALGETVRLDAFDLDALNDPVMRSGYANALTAIFVRSAGPAGYVLFEDIALDAGIDLRFLSPTQAVKLNAALLAQLPTTQRTPFQIASAATFEQFKP